MTFSINRSLSVTAFLFLAAISGLAQKPEIYVQTGHSDSVDSVAFSPDGKTLASGSADSTIKLWDVSGQELKAFKGHSLCVNTVAFSPDGKTLASGSDDKTIKLWNVASGQELKTLKGHSDFVFSVAFSPDGKTLASSTDGNTLGSSSSTDGEIKLWDVASGAELKTLRGHSLSANSIAFSPDGKTLASGGRDNTIKLWDVASGQELKTFKGHSSTVFALAFSPDGTTLASGSFDSTVKLWNVASGQEMKTLKGHTDFVFSVAFSPDGKTLASGAEDKTIKLWDVGSGQELKTLKGHSKQVRSVTFSPDGKTLASGSWDNTIKLWNAASGQELNTLKGHSYFVRSVAFSPDGKTLASGSDAGAIKLWDLASGEEVKTLKGHSNHVESIAYSPDGKTIASGSWDNTIKLWDAASGQELKTLEAHSWYVDSVAFSPDGKTLASGSYDTMIKLWNVASGQELKTLKGHSSYVFSVRFSPDGRTLASASWDSTIKLWNVASGQILNTLKGPSGGVSALAFSPDGKVLASGRDDATVILWDAASGQELKTLTGHSLLVNSVAFSPDGKTLASGSWDNTIKLWNVVSGQELKTLRGHSGFVDSVAFSPDGKTLASGSWDAVINLWDLSSGSNLASLISLDERDWVVVTPDGLFDGSPASWNKIVWRFSNNTFDYAPVEAYFADFYYPGLLTDIFSGKRPKAPTDISQKDRRQPQLKLTRADAPPDETLTARNLKVKINVSQTPAGAQDVRLFRNGSLVRVWHGDVLKGESAVTLEATIPVVAGENRLTAYAFNRDNIKSPDAQLTVTGADSLKRAATAYILAIGVNVYANLRYNLRYAVADSQAFAEEIRRQQSKLGQYADIKVISLTDKDATKLKILNALKALRRQVQPEDALLIYFAGHGTAQHNRFYLIPHDLGYAGPRTALNEAGLQSILSHSISDLELQQEVEGIDAGRILLVVDACNSGQALEAEEKRRGPMNSNGLAQLAYEKGMYILTAAQSYQAAQEPSRLGHGFLTYALVEEGLKSDVADKSPKDGQVLLREWLDYATARVPQMQLEKVAEQKKEGRLLEQVMVLAEGDTGRDRRVQRPRVFYRREAEASPLVVARP